MEKDFEVRDSRFEILRICAIFMIVVGHFSVFGQTFRLTPNTNYLDIIGIKFYSVYGEIGVNLFVLITGYFLGSKAFSMRNSISQAWKIWSETFFYTIILFLISCLYNKEFIGVKALLMSFLPFICKTYWFITAYIILIFLIPFINKMLSVITKKEFQMLIFLLLIFNGFFPTVHNFISTNAVGFGIILVPYVIGAYLSVYGLNIRHGLLIAGLLVVFMYLAMIIGAIVLGPENGNGLVMGLLPQVVGVFIFNEVLKMKKFHSKVINNMATTVFAGYIITEYPPLRLIFWRSINFKNINNIFYVDLLGAMAVMVILFIGVFCVDKMRQYLFKVLKINSFPDIFFKIRK